MHGSAQLSRHSWPMSRGPTTTPERRRRTGEWIRDRRIELSQTLADMARVAGVSKNTLGNAERGDTAIQPLKRPLVERALGWKLGSLKASYERGEQPELAEVEPDAADMAVPRNLTAYSPELMKLLQDPALDDEMRERVLARLQTLHNRFVEEARDWLGLPDTKR